jgi:GST-like protein
VIDLYTWGTPNGRKISIALEEMGLEYRVHAVNIGKDEQFAPAFLKISPNNKIPAIVDHDAPNGSNGGTQSVFESGAILVYLAEKTGLFLRRSGPERVAALEWLFWQMGGLDPMIGQLNWFASPNRPAVPVGIERYTNEGRRLLGVMDKRLSEAPYLAGDDYSIADIACYAWTLSATTYTAKLAPALIPDMPSVRRWLDDVGARPAVQRGMDIPKA